MIVFLKKKDGSYDATGDYNPETNALVVRSGSLVSNDILRSTTFRGAKSIERMRNAHVNNRVVQDDVLFSSPSTAANFVTGRSCNGMIMWKAENGKSIKKEITV